MSFFFQQRTLCRVTSLIACLALVPLSGCGKGGDSTITAPPPKETAEAEVVEVVPQSFETSAENLLAARLSTEEAQDGWIRLFDGHTLYGWDITGAANWRVEDGVIVVDSGKQCLLCTSVVWQDYELVLEFKAGKDTNSGVFLRTPLEPESPDLDCYEVNIAPNDNPFPTAGIVKRQKAEEIEQTFGEWQTMKMRMEGKQLQVTLNDKLLCDYTDPIGLSAGRIGLQHNSGRVEFRNIRLRPLGLEDLLDEDLSKWKKYPEMPGSFTTTDYGWMHVQGGRTQLESKSSYDDFVLFTEYKLPTAEMNSGVFFRCIPGDEMMGYECQLSNETTEGNALEPADCGTGGIFRRQDARIVAGEPDKWVSLLLVAHRESIAAWVNGLQVSNWYDDRKPHENPRKGLRLEPGTLMIQGHDPGTDALIKQFRIMPIAKPPTASSEDPSQN